MPALTAAMSEIFSANVRTLLRASGKTQAIFGEDFDVSQTAVSNWLKGSVPKKAETLTLLAEAAGCSVKELMTQLIVASPKKPFVRPIDSTTLLLPVQLPSVDALTAMFGSLLQTLKSEPDQSQIARRLAQLLPSALAQTAAQLEDQPNCIDHPDTPPKGAEPRPRASREL